MKKDGKYLEPIAGAVVMTEQNLASFVTSRNGRFNWAILLPKRKAWIHTLILFPFALPIANFLGGSWNFSVNLMIEDQEYILGLLSMGFNLLLPTLFLACLFHWGWFVWKLEGQAWYPKAEGFWAGCYATLTIALSFGLVRIFTENLGVCSNPGWGDIGQNLLCNLDNYGFESKSWFGVWFIIAAYCFQAQGVIYAKIDRILHRHLEQSSQVEFSDDELSVNDDILSPAKESLPPNN